MDHVETMAPVRSRVYEDQVLETSSANARQLASRAREHLRARRPKVQVKREKHQQLLWAFVKACAGGDASALFGLLKQDAVLYSDGGGRVQAAINPIYGADRIVRFILDRKSTRLNSSHLG